MQYIKELDLYEINCRFDIPVPPSYVLLRIVPEKCPVGKSVCKEPDKEGNLIVCSHYVRMKEDDSREHDVYVSNKLYCRGHNAIRFIMED